MLHRKLDLKGEFMKKNLLLLLTLTLSFPAFSNTLYECESAEGDHAILTIRSGANSIYWQDEAHAASTEGIFHGIEDAEYSSEKGYLTFLAKDYAMTEDSFWLHKVEANYPGQKTFKVVEVFSNDSQEESETIFECN
jgi:hypothetical protein